MSKNARGLQAYNIKRSLDLLSKAKYLPEPFSNTSFYIFVPKFVAKYTYGFFMLIY